MTPRHYTRREAFERLSACLLGAAPAAWAADPPAALTDAEKEKILLSGTIVKTEEIGHGVTKPIRATLRLGDREHAAKIQVVDKALPDFFGEDNKPVPMRDAWRFNVAAYRLDRVMKLGMVTVAVPRAFQGKPAGFSWWVDDVMFEEVERLQKGIEPPDPEDFTRQREVSRVFDELIINIDRNHSNLLITRSWKLALIDHSRSFNPYRGIRNRENLTRCSRALLEQMRGLTTPKITGAVGRHLTATEVAAVLARRDRIVEFFEKSIREKGEAKVLFA
jgi:hypothetical protein